MSTINYFIHSTFCKDGGIVVKTFKKRAELFLNLKTIYKPFYLNFVIIFLFQIPFVLIGIIQPIIFNILIQKVIIDREIKYLSIVIISTICIYLFESSIIAIQKYYTTKINNTFSLRLKIKLLDILLQLDYEKFNKLNIGNIKNIIDSDSVYLYNFFNLQIINYIAFYVTLVTNCIIMININPILSILGIVSIPISLKITKIMAKGLLKTTEEYREEFGKYETWMFSMLQGWKEIKLQNMYTYMTCKFREFWSKLSNSFFRNQLYWSGDMAFKFFNDFFVTRMNLYFLGGILVFSGNLTVAGLILFMQYFDRFFQSISNINSIDLQLSNAEPAISRVLNILNMHQSNIQNQIKHYKNSFENKLVFDCVSFSYDKKIEDRVIQKIDFEINKGDYIAIVGSSGSGKTTIAKLLLQLYKPLDGKILFDGIPYNEIYPNSFHHLIGGVLQDSELLNITIKENLLIANSNATNEEIELACEQANILDFINSLPNKFETVVGEKGVILSGGQKQRICIARALLHNPNILVFDESTSSLDYESEILIRNSIEKISKSKTVVVIAHRLSSVINAKKIIQISDGKVINIGTHETLLNKRSYQELFINQI
jgi:ABC-type bacteriocin/lantibiotic exporter with double-glycine peptidase domain